MRKTLLTSVATLMLLGSTAARAENAIRQQLETAISAHPGREELIRTNLKRLDPLPADLPDRYILVNLAAQQLWLFENGQVKLTMPVIVGKPHMQTPTMVSEIQYAVVNPYWNVPWDLTRDAYAPRVLAQGTGYLRSLNMEVMANWTVTAPPVAANTVDWKAVQAGRYKLRVRQRPGPGNQMGIIKFMFPNNDGIYLHDTPNKKLFAQPTRTFSSGCIRLADARALAVALFGGMPVSSTAEAKAPLKAPVPIYITYLTAQPMPDGTVAFYPDVYGKDPKYGHAAPAVVAAR